VPDSGNGRYRSIAQGWLQRARIAQGWLQRARIAQGWLQRHASHKDGYSGAHRTKMAAAARSVHEGMSDRNDGARVDRLVLGTVNASTHDVVSAAEIACWIREERTTEARARVALSTFFLEVPLGTQVAFLAHHRIDETKALELAERLEPLGRTLPLQLRRRW
jgi:hypothetical protein